MNSLRNVLTQSEKDGAAVGHFNVADFVMLKAVLGAAAETHLPMLVGASEGEREFLGTRQLSVLFKSMREELELVAFLNADHTHSLAKAVEAAKAGFDAVVINFSALPFDENVASTKETVEAIKAINRAILAEGEIGDIGTGSEIHENAQGGSKSLTRPEEAKQFVHETGIDALAPAVGNMHGMLKSMVQGTTKKHLDIERISEIKAATGVFLTLHGGSGTDDDDFRRAIAAGINIIHINTELRVAWRQSLEESLDKDPDEVVPYKILAPDGRFGERGGQFAAGTVQCATKECGGIVFQHRSAFELTSLRAGSAHCYHFKTRNPGNRKVVVASCNRSWRVWRRGRNQRQSWA